MPQLLNPSLTEIYYATWDNFVSHVHIVCSRFANEMTFVELDYDNQTILLHYSPTVLQGAPANNKFLIFIKNNTPQNNFITAHFIGTVEGHKLKAVKDRTAAIKHLHEVVRIISQSVRPTPKSAPPALSSVYKNQNEIAVGIIALFIIIVLVCLVFQASPGGYSSGKSVHVKGYNKKDGTYVHPYNRSPPHRH